MRLVDNLMDQYEILSYELELLLHILIYQEKYLVK